MSRNIYALLVGIDKYPAGVPKLNGCVNDINAVEACLSERVGDACHIKTLKNEEATYQAIIDGFKNHLCKAGSEDTALFYFAGHGSQEDAPEQFWSLEPERLNETLVCYDSRTESGYDLADKELAYLIGKIAQKNPHIAIILDCCHSGSGTRDPLLETAERRIPLLKRIRPVASYVFPLDEVKQLSVTRSPNENPTGWNLPRGRHVVFSACRDNETAKEYFADGESRGAFSYFLIDALTKVNGSLSYRDLFKQTNNLIRNQVAAQSPQMEATVSEDLEQPFLGGAVAPRTPYFTVSYHNNYGWVMDGGAVHGIAKPSDGETTLLALFPLESSADDLRQLPKAIADGEVVEVLPQLSKLKITRGAESLPQDRRNLKAVVTSQPLPPLGIKIEGDEAGISLVRQALQSAGSNQGHSLYVAEVEDVDKAEFRLLARDGEYLITRPADDRPLVTQIRGYTLHNAAEVVRNLEHIARWTAVVRLSSPANSRIKPGDVQMQIFTGEGDKESAVEIKDAQLRLEHWYDKTEQKWKQPTFRVKLKNNGDETLFCALFDLIEQFSVEVILEGALVRLEPGNEIWLNGGKPLFGSVPKELWEQGVTEFKDVFKLIACTTEFDPTLLVQGELGQPLPVNREATRGIGTLNRLMKRVIDRHISTTEEGELYDDWVASQVTFTFVRPQKSQSIEANSSIDLGAGVTLQPHPSLKAQARLTTVPQSTRDLGNSILPPILREDPSVTQPFQFTASRGTDPGLSALELSIEQKDASTIKSVTPEHPLQLLVDASLQEQEHLLAVGYDGEFFLPLGVGRNKDGKMEINLERLPDPVSEGQRSLGGSIRIFFQKVIAEKLGLEVPYPILAALVEGENGTLRPEAVLEKVKEQVERANRIVVYIHGIIGDTRSMVSTVQQTVVVDGKPQAIADLYDLVLTFDYENLNTSIEGNARWLKQRLEAVGLGADHGKVLHIVAHSMGGLVSRWFIEREGGNKVVQHLFMLGTPNAGSPWPTVQAWATPALAFGLNSLSTVAWPVKVLGTLLTAIEAIDVTLDQMQPGSELLKSLAASDSPGIPYTIIAGNTSIIQPKTEEAKNRLKALLQKVVRGAVEFPFFGQPNDIAVTVHSIKSVSDGRSPQPQVHEVACDHLVYFTNQNGLNALLQAVNQSLG